MAHDSEGADPNADAGGPLPKWMAEQAAAQPSTAPDNSTWEPADADMTWTMSTAEPAPAEVDPFASTPPIPPPPASTPIPPSVSAPPIPPAPPVPQPGVEASPQEYSAAPPVPSALEALPEMAPLNPLPQHGLGLSAPSEPIMVEPQMVPGAVAPQPANPVADPDGWDLIETESQATSTELPWSEPDQKRKQRSLASLYRPLAGGGLAAQALLAVAALAKGVLIWGLIQERSLLGDLRSGVEVTTSRRSDSDALVSAATNAGSILVFIVAVPFVFWFYRAYANGPIITLGKYRNKRDNKIAAWSWFIPVVNAVLPMLIAKEIWKASADPVKGATQPVPVYAWWALWFVGNVLTGVAGSSPGGAPTIDSLMVSNTIGLAAAVIGLGAAVLAIVVVSLVTNRQDARFLLLHQQEMMRNAPVMEQQQHPSLTA